MGSHQEEGGTVTTYQKKLDEICRRIKKQKQQKKWVPFYLQTDALRSSENVKAKAGCFNRPLSAPLPRPLFPPHLGETPEFGGLVWSVLGHLGKDRG